LACSFQPLTCALLGSVDSAARALNAARQIGSGLGVAQMGSLLLRRRAKLIRPRRGAAGRGAGGGLVGVRPAAIGQRVVC
jgi:hypothetical protein